MSIPASESPHQKAERGVTDIEVGGERGREALSRLKNAIGRVEASWRPASPDEGFEIVRRRLFQPLGGDQFVARDAVARAFVDSYGSQQQEFPSECREADYERRMLEYGFAAVARSLRNARFAASGRQGLEFLEAVGHPVAVNPDRELREIATARGWPVKAFREPAFKAS